MNSIYTGIILLIFILLMPAESVAQISFEKLRDDMILEQIKSRGIKDPLTLEAMRRVKRHLFVPEEEQDLAYSDQALPIGYGQTISQPYVVAFMTEAIGINSTSKVLEIGTGSGYQAAVLAEIAEAVYTIEIVEELGLRARETLESLGYDNVETKIGDGYFGWPEHAPFDAIIVTSAAKEVPPALIDQLKENGKMIIPLGNRRTSQTLVLITKKDGKIIKKDLLPVRFVPFVRK